MDLNNNNNKNNDNSNNNINSNSNTNRYSYISFPTSFQNNEHFYENINNGQYSINSSSNNSSKEDDNDEYENLIQVSYINKTIKVSKKKICTILVIIIFILIVLFCTLLALYKTNKIK